MRKRRVRFLQRNWGCISHLISASGVLFFWTLDKPVYEKWASQKAIRGAKRTAQLTQLVTTDCGTHYFSCRGAEVLIPQYTSMAYENQRWAQGAKLRSVADLAFPGVSGLGDLFGLTPNKKAGQFTYSLVADTSPYTHMHPNTRTHPFTHPQASGLLCNINLTFIYSLLWEICAISADQAPNKPYMAFSVSASHLNVECLFQPTKLMRKR